MSTSSSLASSSVPAGVSESSPCPMAGIEETERPVKRMWQPLQSFEPHFQDGRHLPHPPALGAPLWNASNSSLNSTAFVPQRVDGSSGLSVWVNQGIPAAPHHGVTLDHLSGEIKKIMPKYDEVEVSSLVQHDVVMSVSAAAAPEQEPQSDSALDIENAIAYAPIKRKNGDNVQGTSSSKRVKTLEPTSTDPTQPPILTAKPKRRIVTFHHNHHRPPHIVFNAFLDHLQNHSATNEAVHSISFQLKKSEGIMEHALTLKDAFSKVRDFVVPCVVFQAKNKKARWTFVRDAVRAVLKENGCCENLITLNEVDKDKAVPSCHVMCTGSSCDSNPPLGAQSPADNEANLKSKSTKRTATIISAPQQLRSPSGQGSGSGSISSGEAVVPLERQLSKPTNMAPGTPVLGKKAPRLVRRPSLAALRETRCLLLRGKESALSLQLSGVPIDPLEEDFYRAAGASPSASSPPPWRRLGLDTFLVLQAIGCMSKKENLSQQILAFSSRVDRTAKVSDDLNQMVAHMFQDKLHFHCLTDFKQIPGVVKEWREFGTEKLSPSDSQEGPRLPMVVQVRGERNNNSDRLLFVLFESDDIEHDESDPEDSVLDVDLQDEAVETTPLQPNIPQEIGPLHYEPSSKGYFDSQKKIGDQLFDRICQRLEEQKLSLDSFTAIQFLILVPNFISLYNQTLRRLEQSEVLLRCNITTDACNFVTRCAAGENEKKFEAFKKSVKEQPSVLFFLLHDEAHFAIGVSGGSRPTTTVDGEKEIGGGGFADKFLNDNELNAARNVVSLLVTATPYALLTNKSRIPTHNEVDWFMAESESDATNISGYWGIQKYMASMMSPKPHIVEDDQFEVLSASKQGPKRVQVVINAYIGAMNAVQQRSDETVRTTQCSIDMIQNLLHPRTDGTGVMVLLRVVANNHGLQIYNALQKHRNLLGLQQQFEIILDVGDVTLTNKKSLDGLLSPYFLDRLRKFRNDPTFLPKTYEDLVDLPCILILCNKGRMGDTFPPSLQYYDLRLRYSSRPTRAYLEQDIGRICRYATAAADDAPVDSPMNCRPAVYPLPTCFISRPGHKILKPDGDIAVRLAKIKPDSKSTFIENRSFSRFMSGSAVELPLNDMSAFYRERTRPEGDHYDSRNKGDCILSRRFLLTGRPQIGKTGAYLYMLERFADVFKDRIQGIEELVEICNDEPNCISEEAMETDLAARPNMGKFPDYSHMIQQPFKSNVAVGKYGQVSLDTVAVAPNGAAEILPSEVKMVPPVRQHKLHTGPYCAFDSGHFAVCDMCREEKEAASDGLMEYTSVPFEVSGSQLSFSVPHNRYKHLPDPRGFLNYTAATSTTPSVPASVQTPIFMPTSGRHCVGLLNLNHALVTSDGGKVNYVQILVVKATEFKFYREQWPHLVIMELPPAASNKGVGAARYWIKRFAASNIAEALKHAVRLPSWLLMLDDSCLAYRSVVLIKDPLPADGHPAPTNLTRERSCSLYDVLHHMEQDPGRDAFALLGLHRWNARRNLCNAYARCHLFSFLCLNLAMTADVEFDEEKFLWEDIDFNIRASAQHQVLCKYYRFAVVKRCLLEGGCSAYLRRNQLSPTLSLLDQAGAQATAPNAEDLVRSFFSPLNSNNAGIENMTSQGMVELYFNAMAVSLFPTASMDSPVYVQGMHLCLGSVPVVFEHDDVFKSYAGAIIVWQQRDHWNAFLQDNTTNPGLSFVSAMKNVSAGAIVCMLFPIGPDHDVWDHLPFATQNFMRVLPSTKRNDEPLITTAARHNPQYLLLKRTIEASSAN